MIDQKILESISSKEDVARYNTEIVGYEQVKNCASTTLILKLRQTDKTSGETWRKDFIIDSVLEYNIEDKLYESDISGDLQEVI